MPHAPAAAEDLSARASDPGGTDLSQTRISAGPPAAPGPAAAGSFGSQLNHQEMTAQAHVEAVGRSRFDAAAAANGDSTMTACGFPRVGTMYLGFHLIEELGRGAFGRVYLAAQGNLAGRRVALKVARDMIAESQTLAQLQHTNIVPIYSFHVAGSLQAVCMPYFGRTTLADVIRRTTVDGHVPASGRELRSTLNRQAGHSTYGPLPASSLAADDGAAAPRPVPAPHTPEGWDRIEALSYVEAVLLLGAQIADGLAHAHRHGVLHLDLKPANVLLTDDGRPMLLDFNLSADVKARSGERSKVGGTLPYMAPEHLAAFADRTGAAPAVDERSDIFSFGIVLFELLTGGRPYPNLPGPVHEIVPAMIRQRQTAPRVRPLNRAVAPAAEAILLKCLAADPAARYRTAADLRTDLERQLAHRPLAFAGNPSVRERAVKWVRRHPRATSNGAIGGVAAGLILGAGAAAFSQWDHGRDDRAAARFAAHRAAFADAQLFLDDRNQSRPRLAAAAEKLTGLLDRYGVPPTNADRAWLAADDLRRLNAPDRDRVRDDVGEAFYLLAETALVQATAAADRAARETFLAQADTWNAAAAEHAAGRLPRSVAEQKAALADLRGEPQVAARTRMDAAALPADSPRDRYLTGEALARLGRNREALRHLQAATRLDPANFSAWFVRGCVHRALGQDDLAAMAFGACLAVRADFAPVWLNRGMAFGKLRRPDLAREDYDRAIALDPTLTEAYVMRALARDAEADFDGAEADYTAALAAAAPPVRAYFLRADLRLRRGDKAGAAADRAAGLALKPTDELGWIGRAEVRAGDDPIGALGDVNRALDINPFSLDAMQQKAYLLAEHLNRPADALAVLDRSVELHPDSAPARAGRGVLLARQGKRDAARQDAKDALLADLHPSNLYQVGCIYALLSPGRPADRDEAVRLLWAALRAGFGRDIYKSDPDLNPLRDDPAFARMTARVEALEAEGQ